MAGRSTAATLRRRSIGVLSRGHVAALGGAVAVLTWCAPAVANPSARLLYSRSADATECPDEATLRRAVARRFGYDPFFPWAKQAVSVQVWRDHGRPRSRVQLVDDQGVVQGTRELQSDQAACAELFDATALAISIALDLLDPPAGPKPVDTAPPDAPVPADLAPAPELHASSPPPSSSEPAPVSPHERRASPYRFGAFVGVIGNVAPLPAPGLGVFVAGRRGPLSLGLDLRGDLSIPAALHNGARVESAVLAGVVAPCVHIGPAFLCLLGELGTLAAWGLGVGAGRAEWAAFFAAGARAGVEWNLSPSLALQLRCDALANLNPRSLDWDAADSWHWQRWLYAASVGVSTPFL
jgi:hypothetical protein